MPSCWARCPPESQLCRQVRAAGASRPGRARCSRAGPAQEAVQRLPPHRPAWRDGRLGSTGRLAQLRCSLSVVESCAPSTHPLGPVRRSGECRRASGSLQQQPAASGASDGRRCAGGAPAGDLPRWPEFSIAGNGQQAATGASRRPCLPCCKRAVHAAHPCRRLPAQHSCPAHVANSHPHP